MYYQEKVSDVLKNLNTSKKGLSTFEFKKRLKKYGSNELKSRSKISVLKLFFAQLKSFIIYVLIVAALVSFSFGEIVDGSVIITIVILNTLIGFFQEYKAEKAIEMLKELSNLAYLLPIPQTSTTSKFLKILTISQYEAV